MMGTQSPSIRPLVEDAIETLLLVLDELDGDPDLEEPGDLENTTDDAEPSLGWSDKESRTGRYAWLPSPDLEAEHDGREPDDEDVEHDGREEEAGI